MRRADEVKACIVSMIDEFGTTTGDQDRVGDEALQYSRVAFTNFARHCKVCSHAECKYSILKFSAADTCIACLHEMCTPVHDEHPQKRNVKVRLSSHLKIMQNSSTNSNSAQRTQRARECLRRLHAATDDQLDKRCRLQGLGPDRPARGDHESATAVLSAVKAHIPDLIQSSNLEVKDEWKRIYKLLSNKNLLGEMLTLSFSCEHTERIRLALNSERAAHFRVEALSDGGGDLRIAKALYSLCV